MGIPHVLPMAHDGLEEQPWSMKALTAAWRAALSGKHGLVCASMAGAMDAMMVTRTADWNLGIMLFDDDDDDDVGLTFGLLLLLTRQATVINNNIGLSVLCDKRHEVVVGGKPQNRKLPIGDKLLSRHLAY